MKTWLVPCSVVLLLTALACGHTASMPALALRAEKAQEGSEARLASLYVSAGAPTQTTAASRDPKLAMNGTLKIEAKNVESAARDVGRVAVDPGGFIGNAVSGRNAAGNLYATLSMRIPTARVPSVLESLRALGKVTQETLTTEDVSKTVFDLQTRLRVKRGTEERLQGLFASRTGKLGDVIDVEKELERVVGEIEEIEGQQAYYDARVAMATLAVELTALDATPVPGPFAAIGQALREARAAFVSSVATVVYVAGFVLPWLIIASLAWVFVRWARTRLGRRLA